MAEFDLEVKDTTLSRYVIRLLLFLQIRQTGTDAVMRFL